MKTINDVVQEIKKTNGKKYNRGRSWEHCYAFFRRHEDIRHNKKLLDQAALQLGFFLANWGMLRNSFLMVTDYKYYEPIIEVLIDAEYDALWKEDVWQDGKRRETNVKLLFKLVAALRNKMEQEKGYIYKEPDRKTVGGTTDTLVTKIIMGTMGCVPAYDKYFVDGLKKIMGERDVKKVVEKLGIKKRGISIFKEKPFNALLALSSEKPFSEVYAVHIPIGEKEMGLEYTPMKLLDLYFWLHGYYKYW